MAEPGRSFNPHPLTSTEMTVIDFVKQENPREKDATDTVGATGSRVTKLNLGHLFIPTGG